MAKEALNTILDEISSLPLKEQQFVNETLSHRIHESKRMSIADRQKEAEENYRRGKTHTGTPDQLFQELDNA